MSEEQVHDALLRADRLSKVIALLTALGFFLVAAVLVADTMFNMIVAAFVGIGTRIYIPYHVSIRNPAVDKSIQEFEGTGNYHQGAFGAAVVIASVCALAAAVGGIGSWPAYGVGAAAGLLSFFALRSQLPA